MEDKHCHLLVTLLLILSGDVETNPGPFWDKKEDPIENLQNVVDDQADEIAELRDTIDKQADQIASLEDKLEELSDLVKGQGESIEANTAAVTEAKTSQEKARKEEEKVLERLTETDTKLGQELLQQKESLNETLSDLIKDMEDLRMKLESSKNRTEEDSSEVSNRLSLLRREVEELKEKTWELDTTTRNNLVFYGIREDAGGGNAEFTVREVIKKILQISRDMPFVRVTKAPEPDKTGCRPITIQFEKYQDKVCVMQRSKLLKGTNIFLSEDFTKRVKNKRSHLIKFAKEIKKRRPDTRLSLQYDKLYVNNAAYIYNDVKEEVEMLHQENGDEPQSPSKQFNSLRKKASPYAVSQSGQRKGRMTKSMSQDAELMMMGSPTKDMFGLFLNEPTLLDEDTSSDTLNSIDDLV